MSEPRQFGPFYVRLDKDGNLLVNGWGQPYVSTKVGSYAFARAQKEGGTFVQVMLVAVPSSHQPTGDGQ